MVMMMMAWNGDNDDDGRGAVVVAVAVAVSMVLFFVSWRPSPINKKGSCTWRPTPLSQAFLKAVRTNMRYVAGRPADAARLRQV